MFVGKFEHSLDSKNRLALPKKIRSELSKNKELIITCGFEKSLFVYPTKKWQEIATGLRDITNVKGNPKEYREFVRVLSSRTEYMSIDPQGRVLIPQEHIHYAEIKKDIIVVGMLDRIELWSKANWNKYLGKANKSFDSSAEKIFDLGM